MGKVRESGMPEEVLWRTFFDPECILTKLECSGAFDVVEFGCGYGLFTIPAARLVSGTVHALDIYPEMVTATASHVFEAALANVVVQKRDFVTEGCGLPDRSVGYAMLFNILHIEEPVKLLREANRVLVPGGKVGIIHWKHDVKSPRGPSLEIRPRPEQVSEWGEQAGLQFVRYDELTCCSWHWGMLLKNTINLHEGQERA